MTSRRVLAGLVAAIAVAAFVVLAFAGERTPREPAGASASAESSTTTTTEPERTTTTAPEESTTVPEEALDPERDVVAEPIGDRRVIMLKADELTSVHLDTNVVTELEHEIDIEPQSYPPPVMVASGDNVFIKSAGKVYVAPQALDRDVRELGEARMLLNSQTPGRVWVVRERDGGYALDEIRGDGSVVRSSRPLPVDAAPLALAGDGFVLSTFEGLQVWDPGTGQVRWTSPLSATFVGATARHVVWRRQCDVQAPLCVLHVLDLATHNERTIPTAALLGDEFQFGPAGSPDGRYVAATSATYGERPTFKLALVDLESGLIVEANAMQPGRPMWSPDGRWILLMVDGEEGQPVRGLFRVDGTRLREVGIRVPLGNPVATAVIV